MYLHFKRIYFIYFSLKNKNILINLNIYLKKKYILKKIYITLKKLNYKLYTQNIKILNILYILKKKFYQFYLKMEKFLFLKI